MKQTKDYFIILFLFIVTNINGQLNEFMIQSYVEQIEYQIRRPSSIFKIINTNAPWLNNSVYDASNCKIFLDTLKSYNFNSVYFVWDFGETMTNTEQADIAQLKSIIKVDGLDSWKQCNNSPSNYNKLVANSALETYSINNVIGYCIIDEPFVNDSNNVKKNKDGQTDTNTTCNEIPPVNQNTIDIIPDYTNAIKNYNSSLLRFANLCCIFSEFPSDDYYRNNYLQKYINESNPNLLSFDQYPLERYENAKKQTNFFKALYNISLKSVENSIPFIYVLTPFEYLDTQYDNASVRDLPDTSICAKPISKFNYVIYSSLIYNAKGISYWPGFQWVRDDHPYVFKLRYLNNTLNDLKELHCKLLTYSDELLSLNFASVYHKSFNNTIGAVDDLGNSYDENIHPFCSWSNFKNDKYVQQIFYDLDYPIIERARNHSIPEELAISFMTKSNGQIYYWIFNKSLDRAMTLDIRAKYQPFDVLNDTVAIMDVIPDLNGSKMFYTIHLNPGEAKLFTPSEQSTLVSKFITSQTYDNQFYPFESATGNIHITNTDFESGATKSFMANQIRLTSGTRIKAGSIVRLKAYTDCNAISSVPLTNYALMKKGADTNVNKIKKTDFTIYPNPIKKGQNIFIRTNNKDNSKFNIKLLDISGKFINEYKTEQIQTQISTSMLERGVYMIVVNGKTHKLLIK